MRLRWRTKVTPPQDDALHADKAVEAEASLREAQNALCHVRKKNEDGHLIASTLQEIRKINHFGEFWREGMEGR